MVKRNPLVTLFHHTWRHSICVGELAGCHMGSALSSARANKSTSRQCSLSELVWPSGNCTRLVSWQICCQWFVPASAHLSPLTLLFVDTVSCDFALHNLSFETAIRLFIACSDCSDGNSVVQGWDSFAFTRISVEQKLKSVVDDDHFRGKKIDGGKKIKIRSNPSLYLACPHSVVFSSYSWMCAHVALLFWLSKMATRTSSLAVCLFKAYWFLTPSQPRRFNVECTCH